MISGSIAELYATMGLDSSGFVDGLRDAKLGFITAAQDIQLKAEELAKVLTRAQEAMGPTAFNEASIQMTKFAQTVNESRAMIGAFYREWEDAQNRQAVAMDTITTQVISDLKREEQAVKEHVSYISSQYELAIAEDLKREAAMKRITDQVIADTHREQAALKENAAFMSAQYELAIAEDTRREEAMNAITNQVIADFKREELAAQEWAAEMNAAYAAALKEDKARTAETEKNNNLNIGGIQRMIGHMLLFAAVFKTVQAAEEGLTEFAGLQKAEIALKHMTGSATEAIDVLNELRVLSVSDGLQFEHLVKAEQRFVEFGVSVDKVVPLLVAAADAAGALNKPFDEVGNSLERMTESGVANARQLATIGISLKDLSEVLGVTQKQVAEVFKDLTPTQRAEAFTEALSRLKGVAAETAGTLAGEWQKAKNEFGFLTVEMIADSEKVLLAMTKAAQRLALIPQIANALRTGALSYFDNAPAEGIYEHQNSIPRNKPGDFGGETGGDIPPISEEDLKRAAARILSNKAAQAAYEEMVKIEITLNNQVVALVNSQAKTYEDYVARLQEGGKTAKSSLQAIQSELQKVSSELLNMSGKPLKDAQQLIVWLNDAKEKAKEFEQLDSFYKMSLKVVDLTDKFKQETTQLEAASPVLRAYFDRMREGAESAPDALRDAIEKDDVLLKRALEQEKKYAEESEKVAHTLFEGWLAFEKRVQKNAAIQTPIEVQTQNRLNQSEEIPGALPGLEQKELITSPEQQATLKQLDLITQLRGAYKILSLDAKQSGTVQLAAFQAVLDNYDMLAERGDADLETLELGWARVSTQISRIAKTDLPLAIQIYHDYIAALIKAGESQGRINLLQQQELQLLIQEKSLRGQSANEEIIQLENKKIKLAALLETTQALGKIYVKVMNDLDQAVSATSKGLAGLVLDGGKFGDVMMKVVDDLAHKIITDLIDGALRLLGAEIIKNTKLFGDLGATVDNWGAKSASGGGGGLLGLLGLGKKNAPPVQLPSGGDLPVGGDIDFGGGGSAGKSLGSLSKLSTGLGIAGLAVDVASGIAQGVLLSHISSDTGHIEVNTRGALNQLISIQGSLNTYLPELKHLPDIWGALLNNGPMGEIRDVLRYGLVHVTLDSLDPLVNQQKYGPPPLTSIAPPPESSPKTGSPGDSFALDAIKDNTKVTADVLHRGFDVLNPPKPPKPTGYQLQPGESFGPGGSQTGPYQPAATMTVSQFYDQATKVLGLNRETIDADLSKTITQGIKDGWIAVGTTIQQYLAGGGIKGADGKFSTLDPTNNILDQFKLGMISLAEFNAKKQDQTDNEQLAQFSNAKEVIDQLRLQGKTNQEILSFLHQFPTGSDFANASVQTRGVTSGYFGGYSPSAVGDIPTAHPSIASTPFADLTDNSAAVQQFAAVLQQMQADRSASDARANTETLSMSNAATMRQQYNQVLQTGKEADPKNFADWQAFVAQIPKSYGELLTMQDAIDSKFANGLISGYERIISQNKLRADYDAWQMGGNVLAAGGVRTLAAAPVSGQSSMAQYQAMLTSSRVPLQPFTSSFGSVNPLMTSAPGFGANSFNSGVVPVTIIVPSPDGDVVARNFMSSISKRGVRLV